MLSFAEIFTRMNKWPMKPMLLAAVGVGIVVTSIASVVYKNGTLFLQDGKSIPE